MMHYLSESFQNLQALLDKFRSNGTRVGPDNHDLRHDVQEIKRHPLQSIILLLVSKSRENIMMHEVIHS